MITSAARRLGTGANGLSPVQRLSIRFTCYRLTRVATGGYMREVYLRRKSGENEGIRKMIRKPNFNIIISAARRLGTGANELSAVQGSSIRFTCYRLTRAATGGYMREVFLRRNSGENEGIEK